MTNPRKNNIKRLLPSSYLRNLFILLLGLVCFSASAQSIKDQIQRDTMCYIYKLDNAQLDYIYKQAKLKDTTWFFTHKADSCRYDLFDQSKLKNGCYLKTLTTQHNVTAELVINYPFEIETKTIKENHLLYLRNSQNKDEITNAKVRVNTRDCAYDAGFGAYKLNIVTNAKPKNKSNRYVRIQYMGEDYYYYLNKKRNNVYKPSGKSNYGNGPQLSPGYFIVSQPKYRLLDTVKYKAYLTNPFNGKPIKRKVWLTFKGDNKTFWRKKIKRKSLGAYHDQFVLPDSLKIDKEYTLRINYIKRGQDLFTERSFKLEDYKLDKNKYKIIIPKDTFYAGEPLAFYAKATDANGFNLSDTRLSVKLSVEKVFNSYQDTIIFRNDEKANWYKLDTIMNELEATKIHIPNDRLLNGFVKYKVVISMIDERQEKKEFTRYFYWQAKKEHTLFYQRSDTIIARHTHLLKDTSKEFDLFIYQNSKRLDSIRIRTPFKKQIAYNYTRAELREPNTINNYPLSIHQSLLSLVSLKTKRTFDSVRISLSCPLQTPIHYKIYRGKKEIASGAKRNIEFAREDKTNAAYYLLITANIDGTLKDNYHYYKIGQDKKRLNITTNFPKEIYPGSEHAIEISIKDYKGAAKEKVNITAYAASSMFKNDLRKPNIHIPVKRIPQLKQTNLEKPEKEYNINKLTLHQSFRLKDWMVTEFNLHKNDYYKIYHSLQDVYTHYIPLERKKIKTQAVIPNLRESNVIDRRKKTIQVSKKVDDCQLAVLPLLENEITRPSYVKLNGQLIYHNNIDANLPYSTIVKPGTYDIEFRFQDKIFKLKNIKVKAANKTLVCVRLDSMLEKKNSNYVSKDSLPSYSMTANEFKTLDAESIFIHGLQFDTLKVYPLNDENNVRYYFGTSETGRIQVRDENFRVIGLPSNTTQNQFVFDMGKKKKTFSNKPHKVLYLYDNKEEYKKYDSINTPLFGAGRNRVKYYSLLDLANSISPLEEKTEEKKTAQLAFKHTPLSSHRERYSSPIGNYTPKTDEQIYVTIDVQNNDTCSLVACWFINKTNPSLSTFYTKHGSRRTNISYNGTPGTFDIYFVFNNKEYFLLRNYKLVSKEQWIVNADYLQMQKVKEESFTDPIILFNQLTKIPMTPFVSYPDESNIQVKVHSKQIRNAAMINGILRNSQGRTLRNTDIFLERNGRFYIGATTNAKGEFEFLNIPKGDYMLKVFTSSYRPRYAYNVSIKKKAIYSYTIELKDKNSFVPDVMVNENEVQLRVFQAKKESNLTSFGNVFDMDTRAPMHDVKVSYVRNDGKVLASYKSNRTGRYPLYSEDFVDSAYHIVFSKTGYRSLQLKNVELTSSNANQLQVFLRTKNDENNVPIIINLQLDEKTTVVKSNQNKTAEYNKIINTKTTYRASGTGGIDGKLVDEKGQPIPFASIGAFEGGVLKGQAKSNFNGKYKIKPLASGTYTLKVSSVGYNKLEVRGVEVKKNRRSTQNIVMHRSTKKMSAVVITGNKLIDCNSPSNRSLTAYEMSYTPTNNSPLRSLHTIAGVDNGSYGGSVNIAGGRADETLVMIDGMAIPVSGAKGIPADLMKTIGYNGIPAKYGNTTGGVIELKKKGFNLFKAAKAKSLRTKFSNLGFWVPNIITNKEGKAYATVTFPDDVTNWQTYVIAMGRDFLNGVHSTSIKSYKPVMVNSIVPRFLYQSDKLEAKSKFVNLDSAAHNVEIKISLNNQEKIKKIIKLERNYVDSLLLEAKTTDSMEWRAELDLDSYYKDGEQISIPVYKSGLETKDYDLVKLDKDSTMIFNLGENEKTTIYFNNTILENILIEVDKLKNYPYSCNEQKASKIKGLLVEKKIRKQLKQPFKNSGMLKKLINRLERAQKANGSWSWWSNGTANHRMTLYITEVLHEANSKGYNNSGSVLAKAYIKKNIKRFSTSDKIYALYLLKKMNVRIDYDKQMQGVSYYDLNLCDKLYYLNNTHTYKNQLSKAKVYDCLSQITSQGSRRYSNNFFYDPSANMALAIKLLKGTHMQDHVARSITPLISSGKFIANSNTFSKVYLIEAWLETQGKKGKSLATELVINDTIKTVKFPYKYTTTAQSVKIEHSGSAVYSSFVHDIYKENPEKLDSLFDVKTRFITTKDATVSTLSKGKDVTLELDLMSFRTVKNVMIEIPIPSGCSYKGKALPRGNISHIEYYKHKAIYYIENIQLGKTKINIPLNVNFSGDFVIPPARASLMYYPFKAGNNTKKRIQAN